MISRIYRNRTYALKPNFAGTWTNLSNYSCLAAVFRKIGPSFQGFCVSPKKQEHLLLKHAQQHNLRIDDFINIEISSHKGTKERRIDELLFRLNEGDILLVAELSRLGRNMFEVINIINQLSEQGVEVVFVRQPELSTAGPHRKLLLAIYSYFAEAEREFISLRTKQGLAAARASGKKLGRPKGSRDKERKLDPYREQIEEYLQLGLSLSRIRTILNPQLEKPISYPSYRYFVRQDADLLKLWEAQKVKG